MKFPIRRKLVIAFSFVILLTVAVGLVGYFGVQKVNDNYIDLLQTDIENVNTLDNIIITQGNVSQSIQSYIILGDEKYLQNTETQQQEMTALLETLKENMDTNMFDESLQQLVETNNLYYEDSKDLLTAIRADDVARIQQIGQSLNDYDLHISSVAAEMKEGLEEEVNRHIKEVNGTIRGVELTSLGILIVAFIGSIAIGYMIYRGVAVPISTMTQSIQRLAQGDLTIEKMNVTSQDEIREIAEALNSMTETWNGVILRMNDTSTELAAQSEQLSASSEESLASSEMVAHAAEQNMENSEQQANYVAQSVQSLSEVTLGINQISENNEDMLNSASEMLKYIANGVEVVRDVSSHMTDIDSTIQESSNIMEIMAKKSLEIQEVSVLITSIAEQTNLLALNAAIEAARAGENGKGFAVVADEVRQLAEESRVSATKIEEMINDVRLAAELAVTSIETGQTKVTDGLSKTEESLSLFNHIEVSVGDVNSKVESVSAAIEEIQAMSDEVLSSSDQLKELAELSASSSQETGAATEEQLAAIQEITASTQALANLAESLQDEVQQFKVNG